MLVEALQKEREKKPASGLTCTSSGKMLVAELPLHEKKSGPGAIIFPELVQKQKDNGP